MPATNLIKRSATLLAAAVLLTGCAGLSIREKQQVQVLTTQARDTALTCDANDPRRCAIPSPLHELAGEAFAQSGADSKNNPASDSARHYALILDSGNDALVSRLNLIRSATTSIDLQTYIYDEDDAGRLILDELIKAAQRGVKVRILMDQLSALKKVDTLAAVAGLHSNLQVRIFNPVLNRARISYPLYAAAAACCWRKLNHRMHNKLLLVDGAVGITGGRNYQDDYYDWDSSYNFRDRDVLITGPVTRSMRADFERYWFNPLSVQPQMLKDVGRHILKQGVPPLEPHPYESNERVQQVVRAAENTQYVQDTLAGRALAVAGVQYVADSPYKADVESTKPADDPSVTSASYALRDVLRSAQTDVLLQTPYLVMSKAAQAEFLALQGREQPPAIRVSTNSLAATDAFIAYGLSYKYKRRYMRRLGFEIYEYKPFPEQVPGVARAPESTEDQAQDVGLLVATTPRNRGLSPIMKDSAARRFWIPGSNRPVRLLHPSARYGMHAKSMVVDRKTAVIGTHNFDPRGQTYNTEAVLIIRDNAFAEALATSIERDMAPANSWVIAPRKVAVLGGVNYTLGKLSNELPLFDFWPVSYATSFEFEPSEQCPTPLRIRDPKFRDCYRSVGDFPEARVGIKTLLVRFFAAFGSGLAPIM